MLLPIRRANFKVSEFIAFLNGIGAEIGVPTNIYEVVRYKAFTADSKKALTHIVYAKESGALTYTGASADHYRAYLEGIEPDIEERKARRLKNTSAVRAKLLKRDGECCWYCGGLLASAESNVEHLIPISAGGNNALANLVLTHNACNTKAGNLPLAGKLELRAKLRGVTA